MGCACYCSLTGTVTNCNNSQIPEAIVPQGLKCSLPWNFLNISLMPGMRHIVFSSIAMDSGSRRVTFLLLRRAQNLQFSLELSTNLPSLSQTILWFGKQTYRLKAPPTPWKWKRHKQVWVRPLNRFWQTGYTPRSSL